MGELSTSNSIEEIKQLCYKRHIHSYNHKKQDFDIDFILAYYQDNNCYLLSIKEGKMQDVQNEHLGSNIAFSEFQRRGENNNPLEMIEINAGINIDLENGYLIVENAITQVVTFDENDNVIDRKTVISDTKTAASKRENPMPNILLDALKEYKKRRQLEEALFDKSLTKPDDLVFSTVAGSLRTYSGTRTMFERYLEKHKLHDKNIHLHTLRHTFSNMLWEAGENPKVIQGLMGHKDVKTTMIYNSVDKRQMSGSTAILDKVSMEM